MDDPGARSVGRALLTGRRQELRRFGWLHTLRRLGSDLLEFARESFPGRRRARYGDMDFDWDQRVDTSAATVNWRTRLRAALAGAPYQPSEPALFREMMSALPIRFEEFTFVDIGSGKGRALLLAAEYPFRRVVGVELLPELHHIAEENIRRYGGRRCQAVESWCGDAREFVFPPEPLVVYLFNPLLESALAQVIGNLERSLEQAPRAACVVYHNPLLENVLVASRALRKAAGTHQYAIYASTQTASGSATETQRHGEG